MQRPRDAARRQSPPRGARLRAGARTGRDAPRPVEDWFRRAERRDRVPQRRLAPLPAILRRSAALERARSERAGSLDRPARARRVPRSRDGTARLPRPRSPSARVRLCRRIPRSCVDRESMLQQGRVMLWSTHDMEDWMKQRGLTVAVLGVTLALSACGLRPKPETAPTQPEVSPPGPVAKPSQQPARPMARASSLDAYKIE